MNGEMSEDESSRWEVSPLFASGKRRNRAGAEKIVSNSRSPHACLRSISYSRGEIANRFHGETYNVLWSKKNRNNAATGNHAEDIVLDPVDRSPCNFGETTTYYLHPSRRFGKLSFEICDKINKASRYFRNNKLIKNKYK